MVVLCYTIHPCVHPQDPWSTGIPTEDPSLLGIHGVLVSLCIHYVAMLWWYVVSCALHTLHVANHVAMGY